MHVFLNIQKTLPSATKSSEAQSVLETAPDHRAQVIAVPSPCCPCHKSQTTPKGGSCVQQCWERIPGTPRPGWRGSEHPELLSVLDRMSSCPSNPNLL